MYVYYMDVWVYAKSVYIQIRPVHKRKEKWDAVRRVEFVKSVDRMGTMLNFMWTYLQNIRRWMYIECP